MQVMQTEKFTFNEVFYYQKKEVWKGGLGKS